jgi:hypothetical protein
VNDDGAAAAPAATDAIAVASAIAANARRMGRSHDNTVSRLVHPSAAFALVAVGSEVLQRLTRT